MNGIITKADAVYMANEIYTNNWLELGDIIACRYPKKRYRVTETQLRMIALVLLNRKLTAPIM